MNQLNAMRQALEDLNTYQVLSCIGGGAYDPECADDKVCAAMDKLRQAIEQAGKVEPYCYHWVDRWGCNHYADPKESMHPMNAQALYTHPPTAPAPGNTTCNPHPDAPHGFARNASHEADRYVCECEGWMPPAQPAVELKVGECWPEDVMQQWDMYRKLIASGDKGSEPRDWFESLAEMRLTEAPAQQPLTCAWTLEDDDSMPDTWASSCGELWSFIDGGPAENRVIYCHGCGGKVVIGEKT